MSRTTFALTLAIDALRETARLDATRFQLITSPQLSFAPVAHESPRAGERKS